MLTLLLILGLVVLVGLAVRKSDSKRMSRGCCASGPWPPTDLMPAEREPERRTTASRSTSG